MKNILIFSIKFFILIVTLFLFVDITLGKYIYKKFIKEKNIDVDISKLSLRDDFFDHKLSKNFNNLVAWGDKRYKFCTDGNGFRVGCNNINRKSKNFDIGFIGDSFTEGTGVNYENSFVGLIEKKLPQKKIANLGVSSYSPSIYFTKIKRLLNTGYNFKEIIVFLDLSDIVDDTLCYKVIDNKKIERKTSFENCLKNLNEKNTKLDEFLKKNFKFSQILINLLISPKVEESTKIKNQFNHSRSEWTYNYKKNNFNQLDLDIVVSQSVKNMEKLYLLLNKNSINLSLAVYPWPGTLKYDKEKNLHVETWKKFCENKCLKFYDFMPIFFKEFNNKNFYSSYKKVFIEGDIHFNPYGNKVIADNFILQFNE